MPQRLISRSPDLKRLRDEGYDVAIVDGHLVIRNVPYVTADRQVGLGSVVSTLALQADITTTPDTHIVTFVGTEPCDANGQPLERIINARGAVPIGPTLTAAFTFSSKPPEGYPDYHVKMTTYVAILVSEAQVLEPSATAQTFPLVVDDDPDSVFRYTDTATSRAGIGVANARLAGRRLGILGLGGTGGYILDQLAKTPVEEIHLFDGDTFSQHNAFRAPGAATLDELASHPYKVDYFAERYSPMRRGIVAHREYVTADNVHQLAALDFVFIATDANEWKSIILDALEDAGVPFIDVGIGVDLRDGGELGGQLRTTLSAPGTTSDARHHIPTEHGAADIYSTNIQTAELNMLNAGFAIIRWKRFCGFYQDLDNQYTSTYAIDGNYIASEAGTP